MSWTNSLAILSAVDRELAQVAEREVAGPEVVDDGPDAQARTPVERGDRRRRGPEQRRLGDLEDEPGRVQAGLGEDAP